jgi:hypothetical protein
MTVFIDLFFKIIPLYVIIFFGIISGRFLKIKKDTLALLLIYIIAPIIIFHGAFTTQLEFSYLSLPVFFYILCSSIAIFIYKIAKNIWHDSTRNILAFASGSGNTGYFGIPVATAIFGVEAISIMAMIVLGFVLYESTVGFYLTARGSHSVKESINKLIKLPLIYAFGFGLIFNLLGIKLGYIYQDTIRYFQGAYTVLGMLIIGVGISTIKKFGLDIKFLFSTLIIKFLFWPVVIFILILLDKNYFNIYQPKIYNYMILTAVVPIAANTVVYASLLKAHPEKAALAVLISTFLALIYIPIIVTIFIR